MPRPASPNIGSRDELPDHPLWTEITRLQVLHCGVDTEDSNGPMYFAVRPTSVLLCSPHIYGYRNNPVTALRITIILLSQFPQKKKKVNILHGGELSDKTILFPQNIEMTVSGRCCKVEVHSHSPV